MSIGVVLLAATVAAGAPGAVSEQAFLDAAMSDARVLAVLDEPLAIARANRARAGVLANPEASFDREAPGGLPRQDTWSVSWAPPLDGRSWVRGRAAQAGLEAAERRHALSRVELRSRLRAAYADWVLAREGATLGRQLAALADRLARQANAQASRGEASALTARRLMLARVEIRAEAARLDAELAGATAGVRAWAPDLAADAAPARPMLPPVPSDTALWSRSPRLEALDLDLREAESSSSAAARFWALPEFYVGQQLLKGDLADTDGPVYGVRWALPVFDRTQGNRIEAHGRLAATRARGELERARVREGFTAALTAYAALREAAELAADAGPTAARVLAGAAAMFEAGESGVTDLLETLRGVLGGQLAALGSYGAALRAHRELEIAAGRELALGEGGE